MAYLNKQVMVLLRCRRLSGPARAQLSDLTRNVEDLKRESAALQVFFESDVVEHAAAMSLDQEVRAHASAARAAPDGSVDAQAPVEQSAVAALPALLALPFIKSAKRNK